MLAGRVDSGRRLSVTGATAAAGPVTAKHRCVASVQSCSADRRPWKAGIACEFHMQA